jgi:tripartite-type tricarboxylate transporter receptor subunit TctC
MKRLQSRRVRSTVAIALATAAALMHGAAQADSYPDRPIHVVVPYGVGGGTDILARRIGLELSRKFGQSVVIDNRGGAGTAIGSAMVARAAPDGYTLLLTSSNLGVLPALQPNLTFDPVKDFEAVTLFGSSPNVLLVNPSVPAKSLKEFLNYAAHSPAPINYGSSGYGGTGHLGMELLKQMTGVKMTHVPYTSGGPAMTALLGGQVSAVINNITPSVAQIKAGSVRALGVTSKVRSKALPDVPTIAQAANLPNFDLNAWFGVLVPANTPRPIIDKLNQAVNEVVRMPEVKDEFERNGVDVVGSTPEFFAGTVRSDVQRWKKVLTDANIKVD